MTPDNPGFAGLTDAVKAAAMPQVLPGSTARETSSNRNAILCQRAKALHFLPRFRGCGFPRSSRRASPQAERICR